MKLVPKVVTYNSPHHQLMPYVSLRVLVSSSIALCEKDQQQFVHQTCEKDRQQFLRLLATASISSCEKDRQQFVHQPIG